MSQKDKICTCTKFKCHLNRLPDGTSGTLVDARTLRNHEKEDKAQRLGDRALAYKARALKAHEAEIAIAMNNLLLSDIAAHLATFPPVTSDKPNLPINRVSKLVAGLNEIEGVLESLRTKVQAIGLAPFHAGDHMFADKLMALESIKQTLVEQTTRLRTIGRVKTPAVVHMHGVVNTLWQDVQRFLDETTESWTNALDTQIAEPLALAHSQFNTSDHFFLGFSKVVPFLQLVGNCLDIPDVQ
ncbi:hypothetical protein J132_02459 [Termitomyces sp. J132]|nr:hypothetical protein J132_02459 [Termitomyces sp. J132]